MDRAYIKSWAGTPTNQPTTFERCARISFLRLRHGELIPPSETSAGIFAYGKGRRHVVQPRVAALGAELRQRGFGRYTRLGEGSEAFAVRAFTLGNIPKAIRVSEYRPDTTPHSTRLPCDDVFCFQDPAGGPNYWVTIAPIADTRGMTFNDSAAIARVHFTEDSVPADIWPSNIGRYKGQTVIIDYGCWFDKSPKPLAAKALAGSIYLWALKEEAVKTMPEVLGLAADITPYLDDERKARLAAALDQPIATLIAA